MEVFMRIRVTSDSTCDLSPELIQEYGIVISPLYVVMDGKSYKDTIEIKPEDIYAYVARTNKVGSTAALNVADYLDFFRENLEGYDAIVHFTISSDMSSTFANSKIASESFENVYTIDSRNLSTGIGLLILTACDLRDQGLSAKEIYERIEALKPYVRSSFIIDTLEFLYKGGRCSALAAFGANLLKLKPCIEVANGKMGVAKKYRGPITEVIKKYVKRKHMGDS